MDLWKAEEHPAAHKWIAGASYTSWSDRVFYKGLH